MNTNTILYIAKKQAVVVATPRPVPPPLDENWTVEKLPSRLIGGITAEGIRSTGTFPFPR